MAICCDIRYAGEFYVSLDVNLPIGQDAFVFIRMRQLVGNIEIKFSRQPYTHWSVAFTNEPQTVIDAVTQVHGKAVPQLANIIVARIKRTIRRRHVLPNFKIRYPPFFSKPQSILSSVPRSMEKKLNDFSQTTTFDAHVASYSRLPHSNDSNALLFFTFTCDSVPLYNQFSRVERFPVKINDAYDTIGLIYVPTLHSVEAIDPESRKFRVVKGYYISAVVEDSPAQRSGIRPGGILLSVDGIAVASSSMTVDSILKKAVLASRDKIIRLELCNAENSACQLLSFSEALLESEPFLNIALNDDQQPPEDLTSMDSSSTPALRKRHKKNLSNASYKSDAFQSSSYIENLPQLQNISRSNSDTNLNTQLDDLPHSSSMHIASPISATKKFGTTPKELNFLAEKPLHHVSSLPPAQQECVILRYNDNPALDDPERENDDIYVGDVSWTKSKLYPSNPGQNGVINETLSLNCPPNIDTESGKCFVNAVCWIGVPVESDSPLGEPLETDLLTPMKWKQLHAVSYTVFDMTPVFDELNSIANSAAGPSYVKRTGTLFPFAPITPIPSGDGVIGNSKITLPITTQRGFTPELCFGDVTVGFSIQNSVNQQTHRNHKPPFPITRHTDLDAASAMRQRDEQRQATLTLKGMPEKLRLMRENCEHELVTAVSSRSQPCTVCSRSLGLLQRLSRAHAPLTCLRCGLLCHPRCAPLKQGKLVKTPSPTGKPPNLTSNGPLNDSYVDLNQSESLKPPSINLSASNDSLVSNTSNLTGATGGVMSKWTTRAKRIVAAAREKEQKIVAKAAPKISQKWRDFRGRPRGAESIPNVASGTSLSSLDLNEGVEVGEDVDSLLSVDTDMVVAEELIRAWAAKAAESPGSALEGSLADALLNNGESDALLMQLKNLGKELFADSCIEERRERLDSVISRLTDQLDQESERHAEIKTKLKLAAGEQLQQQHKQPGINSSSNEGNSLEQQLLRCDQRIRSLCLLLVHYSSGLDHCMAATLQHSQNVDYGEGNKELTNVDNS